MSRAKAKEAWRSRVARHEDTIITETDDLIKKGLKAFVDYRRAAVEGNPNKAAEEYRRLSDLVKQTGAHLFMAGDKPAQRIRRGQYLCLAFFVSRDHKDLDEAEEIARQLIREEDSGSRISHTAREILELIQELRG